MKHRKKYMIWKKEMDTKEKIQEVRVHARNPLKFL